MTRLHRTAASITIATLVFLGACITATARGIRHVIEDR